MANENRFNTNPYSTVIEEDGKIYWGRARQLYVDITDGVISWQGQENVADYPLEKNVRDGIEYDFSRKTGTLGYINTNDADISSQIQNNILEEIQLLYPELKDLDYLEDVSQNNFRGNTNRCGVRELNLNTTGEIVGRETIDRTFEIVLTTDYVNKKGSDLKQREAKQALIAKMEIIRRKLRKTKAGCYQNIRITKDFNEPECEFIDTDNVVVCRAEITVNYRVNN